MEELDFIKLLKKISQILFEEKERKYVTASVFHRFAPDVLLINLNGYYAKDQVWWEENFVVIVTHEDLHGILYEIGGLTLTWALDNLWSSTIKSRFLVDGNPKSFKWKDFK